MFTKLISQLTKRISWIAVLSRCHDAIKILEAGEKKFQGRLQIRKSIKPQSTVDKFKSPLVKASETKLSFTEIPSKENNKSAFSTHLNNLLQDIGLLNEAVDLDDDPEPIISSFVPKGTSPPPPPHITRQRHVKKKEESIYRIHDDTRLAKMVQTDPMPKCVECERRKKVAHKAVGLQTGDMMTYSVSTQVTEDELIGRIVKNQSLASLTPAQLLAQNASSSSSSKRFVDNDNFDIYPPKASSYNRNSYDYARAAESFSNSGGNLGRFLPPDRERDEPHLGARGRGPPNTGFDLGPRYSYY